ncbi:unnamed protein product [Sphagnum compactum]
MAKLARINDLIVGQYVRVMVATVPQNIFDIIDDESVWAISLASDSNTHCRQSFFNLHLRACNCGDLTNLHLVAVPMFERHTTENMFNMVVKFLNALYSRWCDKLIGVSSNGENTMTGRHSGFVTCMVRSASNKVLHVWCTPHQIDILVKASTKSILDGSWIKFAYSWSLLLAQQEQHIQMLIDTIMTMFSIEMIKELNEGNNEGAGDYVNFEQWRINVDSIIAHIEDQGSFPQKC